VSFLRRPHPHRASILSDAPRRRLLFVMLALVLASGAFAALWANEARAAEEDRQLPKAQHQQQQRPTLPIGGEPAKTDGGMVGQRPPVEKPPAKLSPAEPPSAKPSPAEPPSAKAPPTQKTSPPVDSTPPPPRPEPAPRPQLGPGITFSLENDAEAEGGGTSLAREASHEEGVFAQQDRYYGGGTLPADPKKPPAFAPPRCPRRRPWRSKPIPSPRHRPRSRSPSGRPSGR